MVALSHNPRATVIEGNAEGAALGVSPTADAVGGFGHDHRLTTGNQAARCGKPGGTRAYDNDIRI